MCSFKYLRFNYSIWILAQCANMWKVFAHIENVKETHGNLFVGAIDWALLGKGDDDRTKNSDELKNLED